MTAILGWQGRNELCEWSRKNDSPALEADQCTERATLSVGSTRNNYHVCETCSQLPGFKAMKLRKVVKL